MSRTTAVVIGGGLFGKVAAKTLLSMDYQVTIIDDKRPNAGSGPAACLMKPGWFSSLGPKVYEPSLRVLDDLFGVKDLKFQVAGAPVTTTVHWCDPAHILRQEDTRLREIRDRVISIQPGLVHASTYGYVDATVIVLATGMWSNELQNLVVGLKGLYGAAFLWPTETVENRIQVWAPYRQLVSFNRGDGAWVGDGTAVKFETFTMERIGKSLDRCAGMSEQLERKKAEHTLLCGARPYVDKSRIGKDPCVFEQIRAGNKRLFVMTGGAKNGTIAAGWCAHRLMQELS